MDYLDHVEIDRHVSWRAFEAMAARQEDEAGAADRPGRRTLIRISHSAGDDILMVGREIGGRSAGSARRGRRARSHSACGPICVRSMSPSRRRMVLARQCGRSARRRSDRDERDSATTEAGQSAARAWFEGLQDRIIAALEKLEDDAPGPLRAKVRARPFRAQAVARIDHVRRARRRRAHGDAQRPRLRKGGRACLHGFRHLRRRNSPARYRAPRPIRASGHREFR